MKAEIAYAPSHSRLRDCLNFAMENIIALENGLALQNCAIEDPDQREVLLRAKKYLRAALDLEGENEC